MIEVKNLTKVYGKSFTAVDNISFEIRKGDVVGLLGPNGAGKTTTLKNITCYMTPTSGSITIDGKDVVENSLEVRQKIGYLPESAPLYEDMTVLEYLKFAADMHGVDKSKTDSQIKKVVKDCGLTEKLYESISHLSKGYKQRVGLAQALVSDPEVLVLDEPTVGLDPNQIIEIRELIKKISKEKTIILSSHILAEVEATCDRVLIINKGKIVATGTPEELRTRSRGQTKIIIKAEKSPGKDLGEALLGIEGVLEKKSVKSHEEGTEIFEIEVEKGKDLRKEIISFMSNRGFQLLEISRQELKLEDIFGQLTK